jgi:hypothetical protein
MLRMHNIVKRAGGAKFVGRRRCAGEAQKFIGAEPPCLDKAEVGLIVGVVVQMQLGVEG